MEKSSFQNEYINRKNISPQFFSKEKRAEKKICKFFVFSFFEKTKKEESLSQPLFLFYIYFFSLKKKWRKNFDFNLNFLFLGYEQGHLIRNQK